MNSLEDTIAEFESAVRNLGSPVFERLLPGLSEQYIKRRLLEAGVASEPLVSLYKWRNGTRWDLKENGYEYMELFPEAIMLRLDEALDVISVYVDDQALWPKFLFPVFSNGGGDYLLLDVNPLSSREGMIMSYAPSAIEVRDLVSIYDSVQLLFKSATACIRQNAYVYEKDGTLEVDFSMRRAICRQMNPISDYWKNVQTL